MEVINNNETHRPEKIEMVYTLCSKCHAPLKIMSADIKVDEQKHCYTICKCGSRVDLPDIADRI